MSVFDVFSSSKSRWRMQEKTCLPMISTFAVICMLLVPRGIAAEQSAKGDVRNAADGSYGAHKIEQPSPDTKTAKGSSLAIEAVEDLLPMFLTSFQARQIAAAL